MAWEIEFTEEFETWWHALSEDEQAAVDAKVRVLSEDGPGLGRPTVETLAKMSKHANLKELRVQIAGDAYRVLFAFDPRRVAVLLFGGRKPDEKWYKSAVARADKLYDNHLETLRREGLT